MVNCIASQFSTLMNNEYVCSRARGLKKKARHDEGIKKEHIDVLGSCGVLQEERQREKNEGDNVR